MTTTQTLSQNVRPQKYTLHATWGAPGSLLPGSYGELPRIPAAYFDKLEDARASLQTYIKELRKGISAELSKGTTPNVTPPMHFIIEDGNGHAVESETFMVSPRLPVWEVRFFSKWANERLPEPVKYITTTTEDELWQQLDLKVRGLRTGIAVGHAPSTFLAELRTPDGKTTELFTERTFADYKVPNEDALGAAEGANPRSPLAGLATLLAMAGASR